MLLLFMAAVVAIADTSLTPALGSELATLLLEPLMFGIFSKNMVCVVLVVLVLVLVVGRGEWLLLLPSCLRKRKRRKTKRQHPHRRQSPWCPKDEFGPKQPWDNLDRAFS